MWPNGWMDQDETWHGGGPQPQPHCVRWGCLPIFGPCPWGQTAGWIKMPLGTEVTAQVTLYHMGWHLAPKRGTAATFLFMSIVAKQLYG